MHEFLDTEHGGHKPREPIEIRFYFDRAMGEPRDRPQNRHPLEWTDDSRNSPCELVSLGEWAAVFKLGVQERPNKFELQVPYDLITLAWWQPTALVGDPGRPAILVAAHVGRPTDSNPHVTITPLVHA